MASPDPYKLTGAETRAWVSGDWLYPPSRPETGEPFDLERRVADLEAVVTALILRLTQMQVLP